MFVLEKNSMIFIILDEWVFFIFFVSCLKLPKERTKYYSVFDVKWYDIHDSISTIKQ